MREEQKKMYILAQTAFSQESGFFMVWVCLHNIWIPSTK